jgi:site-specific DNA-methyltransferase (adenine-specific)
MLELNRIHLGDCLQGMKRVPDKSVDMILCDLPYGTTACKWDTIIPFEPLWKQYERIIKDNGAIVLTASQPFTSALVMSNPKWFKYSLVWDKKLSTGFLNAKKQPLRRHEDILVFYKKPPAYNPIMEQRGKIRKKGRTNINAKLTDNYGVFNNTFTENNIYSPTSILEFSNTNRTESIHPTQKPVALFEYLIKTYTNEGETVLDNCMGSGTTAIAALNTNRNFIGFEKDETYHAIACERIRKHTEIKQIQVPDLFSQVG